jgi:hypothetical protein
MPAQSGTYKRKRLTIGVPKEGSWVENRLAYIDLVSSRTTGA